MPMRPVYTASHVSRTSRGAACSKEQSISHWSLGSKNISVSFGADRANPNLYVCLGIVSVAELPPDNLEIEVVQDDKLQAISTRSWSALTRLNTAEKASVSSSKQPLTWYRIDHDLHGSGWKDHIRLCRCIPRLAGGRQAVPGFYRDVLAG